MIEPPLPEAAGTDVGAVAGTDVGETAFGADVAADGDEGTEVAGTADTGAHAATIATLINSRARPMNNERWCPNILLPPFNTGRDSRLNLP